MRIVVVGIGYVGLSVATFLSVNDDVIAIDISQDKIDKVNKRISPIKDELIEEYFLCRDLKLKATSDYKKAYENADFIIICTPTDYKDDVECFDTSSIESVLENVAAVNSKAVVVIKSTVPIGYTENIRKKHNKLNIIFSPEFLRETKALYDCLHPSRIVVGCDLNNSLSIESAQKFADIIKNSSLEDNTTIRIVRYNEAEAIKLFSNTYLAMRVAFFNELDTFARASGYDTKSVIEGVCDDPRIGHYYNNPSFGYGGYCLPKDTKQLVANYKDIPENLISATIKSNQSRKEFVVNEVLKKLKNIDNPIVGVYRLTMKENSDNYRYSAVLDIIEILVLNGVKIKIFEPLLKKYKSYDIVPSIKELLKCDLIIANRVDEETSSIDRSQLFSVDISLYQ